MFHVFYLTEIKSIFVGNTNSANGALMMADKPLTRNLGWIASILLFSIPIFAHLDDLPMQQWDEARLAVNAAEMVHSKSWLVVSYLHSPDLWNVKPPLYIWLSACCMQLLGINELAARLPAAVAAAATCMLLYWFCAYKLKNVFWGIATVLVLICIRGYIALHATRTGDYDALLVFFTTFFCLQFFLYLETFKRSHLVWFITGAALALLTKGIAGCFMFPGLVLYTIVEGKFLKVLKRADIYIAVVLVFLPVVIFYLLREHAAPGYLNAVWENELGGRFTKVLEEHTGDTDFYIQILIKEQLPEFYFFIPLSVIAGLVCKDEMARKMTLFCATLCGLFLLIISNAATKIPWYDVPLYPFFALLTAWFLVMLSQIIAAIEAGKILKYNVVPLMLLLLFCARPYAEQSSRSVHPGEIMVKDANTDMAAFLQQYVKGKATADRVNIVYNDVWQNLYFYQLALESKRIKTIFAEKEQLQPGMEVCAAQKEVKSYIKTHYDVSLLRSFKKVTVYKINGTKQTGTLDSNTHLQ